MVCFSDNSPLHKVKYLSSVFKRLHENLGLKKGDFVFDAAHTHSARKIMYTSELSIYIYHTSYLFIQRIALFSIIIHRRVVRVSTRFRGHFCVRESHFKYHTSNFIHQFCTYISYANFIHKMENLSCQRE